MKFLCWLWIPAWCWLILGYILASGNSQSTTASFFVGVWMLWMLVAAIATAIYVAGRVWRKSQRDSSQA